MSESPVISINRGRFYVVLASILWSLGGMFTRLLQNDTVLHLQEPKLDSMHLAFFRALFAGLFFVPFVTWGGVQFRPLMIGMIACFASMNALYLGAMYLGTAANAILLQNTAPFWVYLFSVYVLKEPINHRNLQAILIGMVGMTLIIVTGLHGDFVRQLPVMAMALASGVTYAGVILFMRTLRSEPSQWLVLLNHLGSAFCLGTGMFIYLGPSAWVDWLTTPTWPQLLFFVVFGVVQMGIPYWLFARGLTVLSPQEAGIITLIEPLLNPLWAFLIDPEKERLPLMTLIGGAILMFALIWRYVPRRSFQ